MPFNLFNVNLGGEGQLRAAQQIGDNIRKWREDREKAEKEIGFADSVMTAAHRDGRVDDEEYTNYLKAPANKKHSMALGQMANIDQDFKQQQLAQRLLEFGQRQQNKTWSPDPATLRRLEAMGIVAAPTSPRSVQYMDTRKNASLPAPGEAVYDDEGNQIGVYDAKGKITKLPAAKPDPMAAMNEMTAQQEIQGIDRQIAELQAELAQGNKKFGPDWNPMATPYADQLRGLLAKRATLTAGGAVTGKKPVAQRVTPDAALTDRQLEGITGQTPLPGATSSAAPQPTPTPAATAPVIDSEPAYAALAPGAQYIDARDGKLKRKKAAQ